MHANARLTHWGRQELVRRIDAGTPVAHAAIEMRVSRPTATKWWKRFRCNPDGVWWVDRSSRPHRCPHQTPEEIEQQILQLRTDRKIGPARIAGQLEMNTSTVHRVLVRHRVNRLSWMDRPTGRVIRRYEHDNPGDLIHIDIKKLGKIAPGGGWRVHGRNDRPRTRAKKRLRVGYCFVHTAVDDHSRLAYSEIHDDERGSTAVEFWHRAQAFFANHGITIKAVLTDNGSCYRSHVFNNTLAEHHIKHRYTRPYRPQTNGKVERFNRTLLDEWAYARPYDSEQERVAELDNWLHLYNHHRTHTAIGGQPPITRVNNQPGQYT